MNTRYWYGLLVCGLLAGCAGYTTAPAPPEMPEDLSMFTLPTPVVAEPEHATGPPVTPPRPAAPNEMLYPFTPATEYSVEVPIGWPIDIVLQAGETVHNVVGGDRAPKEGEDGPRWEVKEGVSESLHEPIPHVFLAAIKPGLTFGLIITTSHRTYYLTCKSVHKTPIRAIRWSYPPASAPPPVRQAGILPAAGQPQSYHIGYRIEHSEPPPAWTPRHIVDDGHKTYILLPVTSRYADAPMIRLIGANGPELVNSRQVSTVIILDRLIHQAELRIGMGKDAETVRITRGRLTTIQCPEAPECPNWPPEPVSPVSKEARDGHGALPR